MSLLLKKEIIKLRREMEELKKELINKIEENNDTKEIKKELPKKTESEHKKTKKREFRG